MGFSMFGMHGYGMMGGAGYGMMGGVGNYRMGVGVVFFMGRRQVRGAAPSLRQRRLHVHDDANVASARSGLGRDDALFRVLFVETRLLLVGDPVVGR
jgi:hypothetical protein